MTMLTAKSPFGSYSDSNIRLFYKTNDYLRGHFVRNHPNYSAALHVTHCLGLIE